MPLEVIKVNFGKQESIFEKLNPFVEKLVNAYKQSQMKKWDNEWQLEAMNILEGAGNQESAKNLITNVNPPEDYIDIEGATNWAKETVSNMNMVQQKKIVTGGLTPTSAIPKTTDQQPEMIPDKMEWNEAFKMISELAPGKIDWSSLTELFRKRIESGKAMGSAAQQFLNMIMGQQPTDQRAELGRNIDMTHKYMSAFFPEKEEVFDDKAFLKANPNMELKSVSSTGHRSYGLKTEEKPVFDFESFLKDNPGWEIKSVSGTGNISIGRKDTTKKWEFDTWEEAQEFIKDHPQENYEWKIETQGEGYNVTAMKKTVTPEGGPKKLVPTDTKIQSIKEDLYNPNLNHEETIANAGLKYDLSNVTGLPTKEQRAKKIYDLALKGTNEYWGIEDSEVVEKDGFIKNETEYANLYAEYEQGAKEYYEATGQVLPKKYLSLEEAGKYTSLTWGKGEKGGYKPVLNTENIPWSWETGGSDKTTQFVNEMIKAGKTFSDYDINKLVSMGVDINKAYELFNQLQGR